MVLALLKILIWPVLIIVGFLVLAQFLNRQAEAALGMSMAECEQTYKHKMKEGFGDDASVVDLVHDRDKEFFDREFIIIMRNGAGISIAIRLSEKTKRVAVVLYQKFDRSGNLVAFQDETIDILIQTSMPNHAASDFKPLHRMESGETILECQKHNHRAAIDSTHGLVMFADDDLRDETHCAPLRGAKRKVDI